MDFLAGEASSDAVDDSEVLVRSSQNEDAENWRPAKRRRIARSEDSSDEYDLPSNEPDNSDDGKKQPRAKHLMHIPEFTGDNEGVFVTQLTTINSSPSRMRPPRWRKKTPEQPQNLISIFTAQGAVFQDASLVGRCEQTQRESADRFDGDDDDDDLAFIEAVQLADGSPSQNDATRSAPTSFRQTTLFGQVSLSHENQPTQPRVHNWPLASRNEPATHHDLDLDALKTWVYPTNLGSIREYQFNIVSRALYHNMLVALPTGLGKTFIAATVMLNWFRWTKSAQIVFVAPTKPLVAQQVDACFHIAGIPRSQTTMLVGNVQPALRERQWNSKRVFFMTPQTLENDLKKGTCDPKRIVLIVVDEAHRAKGEYAYVKVVHFLRRFNTSFRVLALTATPGSTVEAVQAVIDGLDIARIEIRSEEALDIRQYVHMRHIDPIVLENSEEMEMVFELFSNAVRPTMGKLATFNAYWSRDPLSITLFGLKKAKEDWMKTAGRSHNQSVRGMVNAIFGILTRLANPLENLKYHSIAVFYRKMKVFEDEIWQGKGTNAKEIITNEHWKKMMNRLQAWVENRDFADHPKMAYLKDVVLRHFTNDSASNTKIMVFCQYRDSAEEITRGLNKHQPMVKAHVFVGQAASKNSEGMNQKTQQQIVDKFKAGTYNVLVATSIGEEGLDIGEVDLIVCYDASKSPIRLLQRMGRTGRKRAGNIALLLMKGKEERDYESANDNYLKMQQKIALGKDFNFHESSSMRIMPMEITPTVNKKVVDIPIENTQKDWLPEPGKQKRLKAPKKKFHMPDNVEIGFSFVGGKSGNRGSSTECNIAKLPGPDDVCLSSVQITELDERYADIKGNDNEDIQMPQINAHPEKMRTMGMTFIVGHSTTTTLVTKAYKSMHASDRNRVRPMAMPLIHDLVADVEIKLNGNDSRVKTALRDVGRLAYDQDSSLAYDTGEDLWESLRLNTTRSEVPKEVNDLSQKRREREMRAVIEEELPDLEDLLGKSVVTNMRLHAASVAGRRRARNRATRVLSDSDE